VGSECPGGATASRPMRYGQGRLVGASIACTLIQCRPTIMTISRSYHKMLIPWKSPNKDLNPSRRWMILFGFCEAKGASPWPREFRYCCLLVDACRSAKKRRQRPCIFRTLRGHGRADVIAAIFERAKRWVGVFNDSAFQRVASQNERSGNFGRFS